MIEIKPRSEIQISVAADELVVARDAVLRATLTLSHLANEKRQAGDHRTAQKIEVLMHSLDCVTAERGVIKSALVVINGLSSTASVKADINGLGPQGEINAR